MAFLACPSSGIWETRQPVRVRQPGKLLDPRLAETSGVVRGGANSAILWTLNDSGHGSFLFGVDTTGALHHVLSLTDVPNVDWEALSAGPCGADHCLYVGDIGDNRGVRSSVTIYRMVEPKLSGNSERAVQIRDSLVVRYPDGPHDAESLVVTATEDAAIVSKGRDGWTGWYWVPGAAWREGHTVAEPLGRLPIRTSFLLGHLITDAALSPRGDILAIRTYRDIYLFGRHGARRMPDQPLASCRITGLEPQGEGIAWWDESTLVLTSERGWRRRAAPITLLECEGR